MSQNSDENEKSSFIPFAFPSIGPGEEAAVLRVLRSGWLTTGKESLSFESEFASFTGSPHALAVNSATAGLHLALESLGIGKNDYVVTCPYTFNATAEVARYLGAEVSFVDSLPGAYNIDPNALEDFLKKATKLPSAIIPVHFAGELCDMDSIMNIASQYGIKIVEDAAHAFPTRSRLGMAGTIGDIGVYSFYANKTITTGEGGMICTRDAELAKRISIMRLHGIDRPAWDRYTSKKAKWYYQIIDAGYKYNMTDVAAAMGRVQLARTDEFLKARARIAAIYAEGLSKIPGLSLPNPSEGHSWYLYPIQIDEAEFGLSRDALIDALTELAIGVSVHFIPLHIMPYWAKRYSLIPGDFPEAYKSYSREISIPIFPSMTDGQIDRVIDSLSTLSRKK